MAAAACCRLCCLEKADVIMFICVTLPGCCRAGVSTLAFKKTVGRRRCSTRRLIMGLGRLVKRPRCAVSCVCPCQQPHEGFAMLGLHVCVCLAQRTAKTRRRHAGGSARSVRVAVVDQTFLSPFSSPYIDPRSHPRCVHDDVIFTYTAITHSTRHDTTQHSSKQVPRPLLSLPRRTLLSIAHITYTEPIHR